jgi:hypothetical protein
MGIQKDAIGAKVIFEVQEDGAALNISTATSLRLYFKGPSDSAAVEKTAVFNTDGTDGKLKYTKSAADDVNDEAGEWKVQAGFTLGAYQGRTSIESYQVSANL